MRRKFVIEFTADDDDIQDWVKYQQEEGLFFRQPLDWTAVDLLGSNWATGGEMLSIEVTRVEEVEVSE